MRNALLIFIASAIVVMIPIYYVVPKGQAQPIYYFLLAAAWLYLFIRDLGKYIQTRKGTYTNGTIISVKGKGHTASESLYVDFISPIDKQTHRILYETRSAMWEPESNDVEVWVHKTDPAKSLVVDRSSWIFKLVIHSLFFLVLASSAIFLFW